jgi:hypothetical protein
LGWVGLGGVGLSLLFGWLANDFTVNCSALLICKTMHISPEFCTAHVLPKQYRYKKNHNGAEATKLRNAATDLLYSTVEELKAYGTKV